MTGFQSIGLWWYVETWTIFQVWLFTCCGSLNQLNIIKEFMFEHQLFCCSVMNLLAEIYSQEEMIPKKTSKDKQELDLNEVVHVDDVGEGRDLQENPYMLSTLAPRLWPFMRHSITSVRHSAIRTLVSLLNFFLFKCPFQYLNLLKLPSQIIMAMTLVSFPHKYLFTETRILAYLFHLTSSWINVLIPFIYVSFNVIKHMLAWGFYMLRILFYHVSFKNLIFRSDCLKLVISGTFLSHPVHHFGPLLSWEIPCVLFFRICCWNQMMKFCVVQRGFGGSLSRFPI